MTAERFFLPSAGRHMVILNAEVRRHPEDVIVVRKLTSAQEARLAEMKSEDRSEREIFLTLFPPAEQRHPAVPKQLLRLSKVQLAGLIQASVGHPIPSLSRLRRSDLLALLALTRDPSPPAEGPGTTHPDPGTHPIAAHASR